jgi:hypothetical protein
VLLRVSIGIVKYIVHACLFTIKVVAINIKFSKNLDALVVI